MDAKYRVVAKGLAAKQNFSNEKKILKRKKKTGLDANYRILAKGAGRKAEILKSPLFGGYG